MYKLNVSIHSQVTQKGINMKMGVVLLLFLWFRWLDNDIENQEGRILETLRSDLDICHLISEPTHIMWQSKSYIALIFTDQSSIFLETGVYPPS